ncbi:unnamed protein product [Ilex paraguariensis]|uniref:Uncharacterized protein n=1 Tax=Ilex paraguariensis TaxID=185542 RepID=A0ABC8R1G0_9AQUA
MESFNYSDTARLVNLDKMVKKRVNEVVEKVERPAKTSNNTADLDKMVKKQMEKDVVGKVELLGKTSNSINWSPLMDGIVKAPTNSVDAVNIVDEHITSVLYGPRKTRRLPIFEKICPSESSDINK